MEDSNELFEKGEFLAKNKYASKAEKTKGFRYIRRSADLRNPAAMYALGIHYLEIDRTPNEGQLTDTALSFIHTAALEGYLPARVFLNEYCKERLADNIIEDSEYGTEGPLKDFKGEIIEIDREGILTPVDAKLTYEDGVNTLTFSTNIVFDYLDDAINKDAYEKAVIQGIKEWEGTYSVFGNQTLVVKINLMTEPDRLLDSIHVYQMGKEASNIMVKTAKFMGNKRVAQAVEQKRSFATNGLLNWSTGSPKKIFMQSENGRFDDLYELQCVAKHEFGHVLGLGDLYPSVSDKFKGVEKNKFGELDDYYINNEMYNLVMCDHHGLISDNDIEMIVLAFCKDKIQLYQPMKFIGRKTSEALGKGN